MRNSSDHGKQHGDSNHITKCLPNAPQCCKECESGSERSESTTRTLNAGLAISEQTLIGFTPDQSKIMGLPCQLDPAV